MRTQELAEPVPARVSTSTAPVSAGRKASEHWSLLRSYLQRARRGPDLEQVIGDIDLYAQLLDDHAGTDLASARVFEIGYGARPNRQIALQSMGIDSEGVDIEQPLLGLSLDELRSAWRLNGPERMVKSLGRRVLFDPRERSALRRLLAARGAPLHYSAARLHVCDAADIHLPEGSLDLVVSEEVFQQVQPSSLHRIVSAMATWLRPGGLALIRPNVFTGITGGMLQEWTRWTIAHPPRHRRTRPWEHLRADPIQANAYVNRLTLADYRALLKPHFELIEERVKYPNLGREYYTPDVAHELADYSEEELFSNCVLFVLRKAG